MADNIKWILDENPNAKIVLWAHNGHVAAQAAERIGSYRPMGAALREMYGSQMVVFGFAFNQGSFQAVNMGTGGGPSGLRPFTVGPNVAGSLDAVLASAGLPMFALDLRSAPATGPVATWMSQSHPTRWIGAAFSDAGGPQYTANIVPPKTFDAILFVDNTTSARGNGTRR
jgi:erythromycin esterase